MKTNMAKAKVAILVVLITAAISFMAFRPTPTEIFVDGTNGSDVMGDGTTGNPYATMNKGVSVASSGDTVTCRTATYSERIDTAVQTIASGSSWSSPTTIRAQAGHTVTIAPPTAAAPAIYLRGSGNYVPSYIVLQDLILDCTGVQGAVGIQYGAGANHIRFDHVVENNMTGGGGVFISQGGGPVINAYDEFINCTFNVTGGSSANAYDGFEVTESDYCLFKNNTIIQTWGRSLLFLGKGHRILGNTVNGTLAVPPSTRTGILISGTDGSNLAVNNAIRKVATGIRLDVSGQRAFNNSIYGCTTGIQIINFAGFAATTVENNLVFGNTTAITQGGGGTNIVVNNQSTDPSYVDAVNGDLHLQSGSTAINVGLNLAGWLQDDRDGTARPQGAVFDIGAYEYFATGCPYAFSPVDSLDVANPNAGGSFAVTTGSGCSWTATPSDSWVHTSSSGTGSGSITYTLDDNFTAAARSSTIIAAGQIFNIVQDGGLGTNCDYVVTPAQQTFTRLGGGGTLNVSVSDRCAWRVTSNASWIHLTSRTTGLGTSVVIFSIDFNATGASRVSTITVSGIGTAGTTVTVKQKA